MIIGDVGNSATGRPERTLHIEPVEDEPPIRIGGGAIHAGNGKELVVDSSGDVSENWGAARLFLQGSILALLALFRLDHLLFSFLGLI